MRPSPLASSTRLPAATMDPPTPGAVLTLLDEGRIDVGMRAAVELCEWVDASGVGAGDNVMLERLIEVLAENPLVAMGRARWLGYPADPDFIDVALGEGRVCGATARGRQMLQWTLEHSRFVEALRRRRGYLARQIDLLGASHAPGPVAGLFAGYARELLSSGQYASGQVHAHLIGFDARVQGFARALHSSHDVEFHDVALADVIGAAYRLFDCSLAYAPDLADHLSEDALAPLIESVLTWLRPGGEFILPALSPQAETGFLAVAAGWRPNLWSPTRLMRLAQDLGDVAAWLRHDSGCGVSFLHLQRC